jgi:transcriptional regulator NrdR family protein
VICPKCNKPDSVCLDSRETPQGRRRRRECVGKKCKHRWTTYELDQDFIAELQEAVKMLATIRGMLNQKGQTA